ncbi:hypothetical protein LWI29_026231 [Acer saccharum]|uniref:Uncharacterized protein n=1 Tax=Acer saccharum TaxID=4024 RepID=A0AA39TD11_ACESA|nr:hypothetical protein LWI29_026231 [Acer saccharum]
MSFDWSQGVFVAVRGRYQGSGLAGDSVSACPVAHCQAASSTISFFMLAAFLQVFYWGNPASPCASGSFFIPCELEARAGGSPYGAGGASELQGVHLRRTAQVVGWHCKG